MIMLGLFTGTGTVAAAEDTACFTIERYQIKGNTLLDYTRLEEGLHFYTGINKTAQDVEAARSFLEKRYHQEGYPTVLVNIPRQDVTEGVVVLEVIESTIGDVRVTGNRYHTKEKILEKLPLFRRGEILYVPAYQAQLAKANRRPDLSVSPVLMPGKELGTTDVDLKVTDHFPLHGSLEVNNRNAHDTTPWRLNAVLHYDNLWQAEHSLTLQYQMSPRNLKEVWALAASYVLPAPWNDDHMLAAYGVISDSNTAFGEGFEMIGKGQIVGLQYVLPLPFYKLYAHNLTLGADYKHFDENLGFSDESESIATPVTYLLFSAQYRSSLEDAGGATRLDAGLRCAVRGFVTSVDEIEEKRYDARASFTVMTIALERDQMLFRGTTAHVGLDYQATDQSLISNEQYSAGGMQSVRGYHESEAAGDEAVHTVLELRGLDLVGLMRASMPVTAVPYLFDEAARLSINNPLPSQAKYTTLHGAGVGVRGGLGRYLDYELDYAMALKDTDQTDKGETMLHFLMKAQF